MRKKLICLVGLPGVGKTTVGKDLANALKYQFIDLDAKIEQTQGMSIKELFEKHGEDGFRSLEHIVLKAVLSSLEENSGTVLSCGGGTPCFQNNMALLKIGGVVVYLEEDLHTIALHLEESNAKKVERPMFKGLKTAMILHELWLERRSIYEQSHVITGIASVYNSHLFTNRLDLFTK
ncbi:MAG: shikimate kinase [Bacteroidia bacterium]|jgi:shikimate kinase